MKSGSWNKQKSVSVLSLQGEIPKMFSGLLKGGQNMKNWSLSFL